jgi:nucleoside-diphosphate-sugar epimerase
MIPPDSLKQPILILGANGFIGRAVVAGLARTDWASPILGVRNRSMMTGPDRLERRTVDATDMASLSAAVRAVTGIVNCVAGDANTIVESAKLLFDVARRLDRPPRIVHLSSMAVYGSAEGLVDETAPLLGDLGPYSKAKIDAETLAKTYPHVVVLRPGCVFGPESEQWSIRIARLLTAHRLGDLGSAGDGYFNLVDIDDVVLATMRALERPSLDGQVFNLSTRNPPTWNQFLIRFAIALQAVPVRRISQRRLKIEMKLLAPPLKVAEIAARALRFPAGRLPTLMPPSMVRLMQQAIRLDTTRAEVDLGVVSGEPQAAIERTAKWYLSSRQHS